MFYLQVVLRELVKQIRNSELRGCCIFEKRAYFAVRVVSLLPVSLIPKIKPSDSSACTVDAEIPITSNTFRQNLKRRRPFLFCRVSRIFCQIFLLFSSFFSFWNVFEHVQIASACQWERNILSMQTYVRKYLITKSMQLTYILAVFK